MFQYYTQVLKKYADFKGRARRKEYWYFTLVNVIIIYGLQILGIALVGADMAALGGIIAMLVGLYALATFIPALAAGVRRMHDVGKSGWFLLIPIYNLILAVTEGQKGTNEYGPDPKSAENAISQAETY